MKKTYRVVVVVLLVVGFVKTLFGEIAEAAFCLAVASFFFSMEKDL